MTGHLGLAASAFLDGALEPSRRDEVLVHLAHCASCRAELQVQRGLRSALRELPGPRLPDELATRLLAVAVQSPTPAVHRTGPAPAGRSPLRRRHRRGVRRAAVGGALLALGLGGTLGLAGPPPPGPVARVDPTSARFAREHSSAATEVPFDEPDVVSASLNQAP